MKCKNNIAQITGVFIVIFLLSVFISCANMTKNTYPEDYNGVPYSDSQYSKGAQTIPGRIECKYFDLGGEGVAYHDTDSINHGSGAYNYQTGHCDNVSKYICHFRESEGIDLSFTKDFLDFNHSNPVDPDPEQGFIGWTRDGEWCNYTVDVKKRGTYKVGLFYSKEIVSFQLYLNGKLAGEYKTTLETPNYHTWNYDSDLGTITFNKKGLNLITLKYSRGANYAYLDFYK